MRKPLIGILVAVMVLALAVPVFAAAMTTEQSQEIAGLQQQTLTIKKQIVDKFVAAGKMTAEQGEEAKARIDEKIKYLQENPDCFTECDGDGPMFNLGENQGRRHGKSLGDENGATQKGMRYQQQTLQSETTENI